jgi:glycosyltransferase involved in cell wall biosynthesis
LNDVAPDLDARLCARLEAASIACGDVVLANSAALAAIAREDFAGALAPGRLGVLPLGVDTDRFAPADDGWLKAELGLEADVPLVLYVGRLERRKGVETLVEAFGRMRDRHPRAVLALAGFSTDTGPEGQSLLEVLRERAGALGATGHVRFLGHVPYDLVPRYYAGCDLFVAPSLMEPFGMIYLEAMACGRVAIGCDAGGVPEIITHGRTGYLVPPADAEALAASMAELLQFPSWRARIGQAARQDVLARFSLPVVGARTEAYYRAAIAARAKGQAATGLAGLVEAYGPPA